MIRVILVGIWLFVVIMVEEIVEKWLLFNLLEVEENVVDYGNVEDEGNEVLLGFFLVGKLYILKIFNEDVMKRIF